MKKEKNVPYLYLENAPAAAIAGRNRGKAKGIGKSPSNLAVAFDLDKLDKGLHEVRFRLFIENKFDKKILNEFKTIDEWNISSFKLSKTAY